MMTTPPANSHERAQLSYEAAGWIVLWQPQPTMEADPRTLLAKSAEPRPGNLRYTMDAGEAYLLGELRDGNGLLAISTEYDRLTAGVCDPALEVSPDDVASALTETGYAWSLSQDDPGVWQAVASDPRGYRCDLSAKIMAGGMQVHGVLAAWETDLSEPSQLAVARFLIAAHNRVRFARFTLQNRGAFAVSFATADRLEIELPDSVFAVAAACRLVWREVRALADDQVARTYLEMIE